MCQYHRSWRKSWRLWLVRSSATLVQASGDSTGGRAHIEPIVDVPVPQILEQNVDVIKVIPEEWMSNRIVQQISVWEGLCVFSFESVWEGSCGRHVPHVLLRSPRPHATVDSECKRWNLEHVVFSTYYHTSHWVRFSGCLILFSTYSLAFKWVWKNKICLLSWLRLLQFVPTVCIVRPTHHSPFDVLRTLTHAVAARLRLSVPTWQHVYRRVLHELDIEFEPTRHWTKQFLHSLQLSWKLAATCNRHRPSEADIARERKLLQLLVIYLCHRFGTAQDRIRNLDETAVRMVPSGERGWSKRAESAHVFASRAFVTVTLAANIRGGMETQIVYEENTDRVHRHGPPFPRQLVSHSPTHWITQDAPLDMIDAIDTDMNARAGDAGLIPCLLVLDCATQHVAKEFRSIMRDTRPHIKLCYVQRNFTAYTLPLDRAYMRASTSSIRQKVSKHFAEFFLEAEPNFKHVNLDSQHVGAPTAVALIRAQHRTQAARNIQPSSIGTRWSSVSFSQKQNAFWRRENCFHEAQPRNLTRQMPRPKPPTVSQRHT